MTRITDFGRKRTYLKAGFGDNGGFVDTNGEKRETDEQPVSETIGESTNSTKKRKRRKKSNAEAELDAEGGGKSSKELGRTPSTEGKKAKSGMKKERIHKKHDKAVSSEQRRLNRIVNRKTDMTCLRCRQKGHSVKECPETHNELAPDDSSGDKTRRSNSNNAKPGVGICYRCGSRRHNLSRCKKPVDPENSLPFASCFVCSKSGHLASSCPQNAGKGIYPNGGSCMLCKQTSHLAKDCPSKSKEMSSNASVLVGDARVEGGGDEDGFHTMARRRDSVRREESTLKKLGSDNVQGDLQKTKPKVVVFKA